MNREASEVNWKKAFQEELKLGTVTPSSCWTWIWIEQDFPRHLGYLGFEGNKIYILCLTGEQKTISPDGTLTRIQMKNRLIISKDNKLCYWSSGSLRDFYSGNPVNRDFFFGVVPSWPGTKRYEKKFLSGGKTQLINPDGKVVRSWNDFRRILSIFHGKPVWRISDLEREVTIGVSHL